MEVLLIIGRVLFSLIFVGAGIGHIVQPRETASYAESRGMTSPDWLVRLSGVLMAAGGLGVIFGVWMDLAALGLTVYVLIAGFMIHHFWSDEEPAKSTETALFMKNVAIAGAGLIIFVLSASGADMGWELGSSAFNL